MPGHRYDIIALDLDGTLLSPDGSVSAANKDAVRRARDAGITIIVGTGRGLVECRHALDAIEQTDPVVVAGGAIISDPVTNHTLHRFAIDETLVRRGVERMLSHGLPALVLKDPVAAGYDYLVVRGEPTLPLDPVTEWWFEKMNVKVRHAPRVEHDDHPEHTVRVGVCGRARKLSTIRRDLDEVFGDSAIVHHFPAVVAPQHVRETEDEGTLDILELFDRHATKWNAIRWIAERRGVDASRIAAIGDEINDVAMIEAAGLGVAMGNAIPAVRDRAKRQTRSNREDGVAHAINAILAGEW
ncbi:MAG: HAD hydrolase family protein [Planctomycetota bacterium]|nr:HAD hydrolase family protein [Planctomycetota bacterium]